mmetsp:Transcript_4461/g.16743  ORF Transcript_4461/g.16743 Transcript_4461/m.16743 type:complete len:286 (-) Transcript_4461:21-878(-)
MFFLFRSFFLSDPRFLFSSRTLLAFSACFTSFFFAVLFDFCWGSFEARFRHACIFSRASSTFCDCVRNLLDWITSSPSLFTLFFSSTISRRATQGCSQSDARSRCSRMSTFVFTLLTFCPPAPPLRANEMVTSSLVTFRGGSVHSPGSGIGRVSSTRGPEMPRNVSTSFGPLSFSGVPSKSSSSSYHAGSSSSSSSQYSSSYPPLPYARTRRSLSPCPVNPSSNRRARTVKGSPRGGHDRCSPARATVAARWNQPLAWVGRAAVPHDETNRRQSPSIVRHPVAGM